MFDKKLEFASRSLIAIVQSDSVREDLQFITTKLPGLSVAIKQTDDSLQDAASLVNGSADLVIIEADLSHPQSEDVLKKLCDYVSQRGSLIVIGDNVTPANSRLLFKAGVTDVLSAPINRRDLLLSLESAFGEALKKQSQDVKKTGKIITLMKCGGGVGATTLATNCAHSLMNEGGPKKASLFKKKALDKEPPSVAVFDFNVQFGTVAVSLNLEPRSGLLDLRKAEDRLDSALLQSSIQKHESGLNILSAPADIVPFNAFSAEFFDEVLAIARSQFDYVLLDIPLAWTGWTQGILEKSDLVMPIMTPNIEHVHNARKILSGLDHLKISRSNTLLAINKVSKSVASGGRLAQIQKITDRKTVVFQEDYKTYTDASDRGALLHDVFSSSSVMKDFEKCRASIIEQLGNFEQMATPTPKVVDPSLAIPEMRL